MLDAVLRDLRFAARALRRRRALTAAAVVTLGLGIGANAAIFSLVRAVLLRPLPYAEPERIVMVANHRVGQPVEHDQHGTLTGENVMAWQADTRAFESIALIESWMTNLEPRLDVMGAQGADRIRGAFVTPNFFELLGTRAATGRTLDSRDTQPLAVISDAFWRRRFGADPSVIGTTIDALQPRVGRVRFTIAGVLPPAFRFTYPLETEMWVLFPWTDVLRTGALQYQMIGRLSPGVTPAQASAALTQVRQRLYPSRQPNTEQITLVEPMPLHVAEASRPGVLLLAGGAAVVLLIACVNVALLLLATIADRRREIALRTAIGADRRHIVRHVLSESLLVSIGGAALGLALAAAAMPLLRVLVPPLVPRGDETRLDPVVLGMAALVTIATAIVCGIAPAWLAQRHGVQASLRHASGTATPDRHMTLWRRGIVVTQVSVVCVLLVTAGLLLHSFVRMQQVNLGFEDGGLLTMEMRLLNPKYHTQAGRIADFQRQLMERVRALPGVEQASMTTAIPMSGGTDWMYAIRPVGGRARSFANMRVVDHEFFATMRIPLVAGRLFTAADDARTPRVAIVSEQYARALFGDGPPLGRSLDLERDGQAEIVGVVADVRHEDVKKAASPGLYFPRAQMESELVSLVVRPASGAGGLPAAIRSVIRELDPEQPIDRVGTIASILGRNMSEERFYTVATAGFAATAVLLALVGLTGVVGRTVTERLREIAVRIALGAEPRRLAARAIGHAMLPVIVGLGIGVVAARSASRLLESLLFEVSALDVTTYAVTVLVLAGAAALACYLPARRAMRVEPMSILKSE